MNLYKIEKTRTNSLGEYTIVNYVVADSLETLAKENYTFDYIKLVSSDVKILIAEQSDPKG